MYSSVVEDEPRIGAYPGRLIEQSNEIVDIVVSILEVQQALDNFKRDLSIVGRKRRRRRARYRHSLGSACQWSRRSWRRTEGR
jgi:hypothetical protein